MSLEKNPCCECNYILEKVIKIDKIQKDIIGNTNLLCTSCDVSLLSSANNTIPITFYTNCCEPFSALVEIGGTTTTFFRIESIRCNRYVTLRLLVDTAGVLTASTMTVILDLESVIGIQCFEPISVEVCTTSFEN